MENRAYALAAGTFVLLLGIALVVGVLWLNRDERVGGAPYIVQTTRAVSGLKVEAPVRFRGVDVGKVESIRFDPVEPGGVVVGLTVDPDAPITRGTYAQLGSQGVTGLAFVVLDDDGDKPQSLTAAESAANRIPVRQSYFEEIAGTGKNLVADANDVARRLNALLSEPNQAQLLRTLSGLEEATRAVASAAGKLEPALRNLPAVTEDTRKALARADELLGNMNKLTLELTQRVDALERMSKGAEQVGAAAQALSRATVDDTLPRVHALLDELARNSRQLDRLLSELNDRPSSLVFGRPAPAPGPGEPGFSSGGGSR